MSDAVSVGMERLICYLGRFAFLFTGAVVIAVVASFDVTIIELGIWIIIGLMLILMSLYPPPAFRVEGDST